MHLVASTFITYIFKIFARSRTLKAREFANTKTMVALLVIAVVVAVIVLVLVPLSMPPKRTEPESSTSPPLSGSANNTAVPTIVGGFRSPGSIIGNIIDVDLLSGMASLDIENLQDQVSIRFTAPESGLAVRLVINALAVEGNPKVILGLQEDINGLPSGSWMGSEDNNVEVEVPSEKGFIKGELPRVVSIVEKQVYHIVVVPSPDAEGVAAVSAYLANSGYQPLNSSDPDLNWEDKAINTLKYSQGEWAVQSRYPIFMVELSDGKFFGQPYSLAAPWVIYGERYVGQTIIPAATARLEKIAFVINRMGEPNDSLYYTIFDSANSVLVSGTFASLEDTGIHISWKEVELSGSVTLEAGQLYRVVIFSPNSDLENGYRLIGHEFSANPEIGYGGLQHQLTTSYDRGITWFEWNDADAIFKLITK